MLNDLNNTVKSKIRMDIKHDQIICYIEQTLYLTHRSVQKHKQIKGGKICKKKAEIPVLMLHKLKHQRI